MFVLDLNMHVLHAVYLFLLIGCMWGQESLPKNGLHPTSQSKCIVITHVPVSLWVRTIIMVLEHSLSALKGSQALPGLSLWFKYSVIMFLSPPDAISMVSAAPTHTGSTLGSLIWSCPTGNLHSLRRHQSHEKWLACSVHLLSGHYVNCFMHPWIPMAPRRKTLLSSLCR